mmetsp:Transcript_27977/g.71501  ORF Transcript_27977/g.71501 Transcript_27977/m.71501 type:complete len:178 (+) Transcript_27977:32-565(+)
MSTRSQSIPTTVIGAHMPRPINVTPLHSALTKEPSKSVVMPQPIEPHRLEKRTVEMLDKDEAYDSSTSDEYEVVYVMRRKRHKRKRHKGPGSPATAAAASESSVNTQFGDWVKPESDMSAANLCIDAGLGMCLLDEPSCESDMAGSPKVTTDQTSNAVVQMCLEYFGLDAEFCYSLC